MALSQSLLFGERVQSSPAEEFWGMYSMAPSGMINTTNYSGSSFWPGTQDFCFETWIYIESWSNTPALLAAWGSGGNASGPAASNFALTISPGFLGNGITISARILGSQTTVITSRQADYFTGRWCYLAMSRIGTTINVWFDNILFGQITDFSGDISYANVGGDGWWFSGGPIGDRDETFGFGVACTFRNMRWTIGSGIYPDEYDFTPPSFFDNITPVTGTQFIWWPASNTYAGNWAAAASGSPWIPDYNPNSLQFAHTNGSSNYMTPDILPYVYPFDPLTPYYLGPISASQGTWTNNGIAPAQPVYANDGPPSIIGTTYGDFTASGTNVNLTSTDAGTFGGTGYDGMNVVPLTMYLWFWVPASITDECKNIISVEATNGFCLNIGRPGQGIDWVSIYTFDGVEKAYGKHIWARNAWNYLVISRPGTSYVASPDHPSPFYAWAGTYNQTYAQAVPLTDTGGSVMAFETYGTISIGSRVGSSVSCQMYIALLQTFASYFNAYPAPVYTGTETQVPVQTFTTRQPQSNLTFTFQGTPGSALIQPGGF